MINRKLSDDGTTLHLIFDERFEFVEVQTLIRECENAMATIEQVVLDIAALRFIDTSMLAQFISIYRGLADAAGDSIVFSMRNCSEHARKVLEVSRLDRIFELEGDPVS